MLSSFDPLYSSLCVCLQRHGNFFANTANICGPDTQRESRNYDYDKLSLRLDDWVLGAEMKLLGQEMFSYYTEQFRVLELIRTDYNLADKAIATPVMAERSGFQQIVEAWLLSWELVFHEDFSWFSGDPRSKLHLGSATRAAKGAEE